MDFMPDRDGTEGDVGVAGDDRLAGRRPARRQHPVVAAVAFVTATPPPGPLPEAERGSRRSLPPPLRLGEGTGGRGGRAVKRQDGFVLGLGQEERPVE